MRNTFLGFVSCLLAVPAALEGCAKDSCEVEPNGAECKHDMGIPNPDDPLATAVSPRRIPKKLGTKLTIQVSGYDGASVKLSQGNINTDLGTLDKSGHLEPSLSMSALSPYSLGLAQVTVTKGGLTDQTFPLHIYADPIFNIDAGNQYWAIKDVRRDGGGNANLQPVMIGVSSSKTIQVLNQYTSGSVPNQQQVAMTYALNYGATPNLSKQSLFELPMPVFDMQVPVGFAMSDSQITFAGSQMSDSLTPSRLVKCWPSSANTCSPSDTYAATKMAMLCGEHSGSLMAGLIDGTVQAFSDYSLTQTVPIMPAVNPAKLEVAAIAIGDLNGDQKPDLAIFYKTAGQESVYLGDGSGLTLSETYSKGLQRATQTLLGGVAPDAVRLGDLDGDLLDDLAMSKGTKLIIAANQADGGFNHLADWDSVGAASNALGEITSIGIGVLAPASSKSASILLTARATNRLAVLLNQTTD